MPSSPPTALPQSITKSVISCLIFSTSQGLCADPLWYMPLFGLQCDHFGDICCIISPGFLQLRICMSLFNGNLSPSPPHVSRCPSPHPPFFFRWVTVLFALSISTCCYVTGAHWGVLWGKRYLRPQKISISKTLLFHISHFSFLTHH